MHFDPPKSPTEFWTNEDFWPREDKRFFFLARAVQMVGRALFPADWTGREPFTMSVRRLPERQAEASTWEKQAAANLIHDKFPLLAGEAPKPQPQLLGYLGDPNSLLALGPTFPADQWEFARLFWDDQISRRQPVIDRKRAVMEWFVERICDEKLLRAVVQDRITLQPFLDAPENWNLKWQRLETRFRDCAYIPSTPSNIADTPTHDVFVFREDLEKLLSAVDCEEPQEPQGSLQLEAENTVSAPTKISVTNNAHTAPAINLVREKLIETDDTILRDDAYALVLAADLHIAKNHFRNKVWPQARIAAGKPKDAAPGPKRSADNSAA